MSTERTPLTATAETAGLLNSFHWSQLQGRKRRLRQFQCCLCALLVTLFVTVAVITVSYIEVDEFKESVDAGTNALRARDDLEERPAVLLMSSPSYRHQKAMATTNKANGLARMGYARNAASKKWSEGRNRYIDESHPMKDMCHERISQLIDEATWSPDFKCTRPKPRPLCPSNHTQRYRTFNGTCNNLNNPDLWGVAYTSFRRSLLPWYSDGVSSPRTASNNLALPSATKISSEVHRPLYRNDPKFTVILAVWGQFLDHDITATALSHNKNGSALACCAYKDYGHPECFPVVNTENGQCMEFVRSAPAPSCCFGPRNQINQASAYIDGSVIYGSDDELAKKLRNYKNGSLLMFTTEDGRDLLPPSYDLHDGCNRAQMNKEGKYCFLSGDARSNENLHLTTMHLLWARNHNNIAKDLLLQNPNWDEDKLYHESRHIVAAQMQHITYNEFLPVIMGHKLMEECNLFVSIDRYYQGYNETVDATIANEFASAAFRFAHTLIPGLMKFVANDTTSIDYVQLHKMLFDPYRLYNAGELDVILRGAMLTNIEASDTFFTDELKSHLFEDTEDNQSDKEKCPGLDLVSLNIQRGRDHGLAGYPEWRKFCGLSVPRNFDDLLSYMDSDSVTRISELYSSVKDIDLYTGALSERPLEGSLLGPTASCIILDQFIRLKWGDRFWYENPNGPQAFTADQIKEIKKTSLAGVICDTSDSIDYITPWVMQRELNSTNKYTPCTEVGRIDFTKWKESK